MNFKWFGPIALLAALVIGDQIRINRPAHKYRLTVEVETPEGRKSASGVVAVHPDRSYSRRGQTRTLGDAVFVDLGQGKNLVALLAHIDNNKLELDGDQLRRLARLYGRRRRQAGLIQRDEPQTGIVPVKGRACSGAGELRRSGRSRPGAGRGAGRCRSGAREGLSPPGNHRRGGAERILADRFRRHAGRARHARHSGEIAVAQRRRSIRPPPRSARPGCPASTGSTPGRPSRESSGGSASFSGRSERPRQCLFGAAARERLDQGRVEIGCVRVQRLCKIS